MDDGAKAGDVTSERAVKSEPRPSSRLLRAMLAAVLLLLTVVNILHVWPLMVHFSGMRRVRPTFRSFMLAQRFSKMVLVTVSGYDLSLQARFPSLPIFSFSRCLSIIHLMSFSRFCRWRACRLPLLSGYGIL